MVLKSSGAGLFALPKGVAGDWKSLRELFGAVEKTAEFESAPILTAFGGNPKYEARNSKPRKEKSAFGEEEDRAAPRRGCSLCGPKIHEGLLAPYQSPGRGSAPAPQYFS